MVENEPTPKVLIKCYIEDFLSKFQLVANKVTSWSNIVSNNKYPSEKLVKDSLDNKQDILISGTNIKTINNDSILGNGNIDIQGSSDIVTEWEQTLSDEKVPSEKLTKNHFDKLMNGELDESIDEHQINLNEYIEIRDWWDLGYSDYSICIYEYLYGNDWEFTVDIDELIFDSTVEDNTIGTFILESYNEYIYLTWDDSIINIIETVNFDWIDEYGQLPQSNQNIKINWKMEYYNEMNNLTLTFYVNDIEEYKRVYNNIYLEYPSISILNNKDFLNSITVYSKPIVSNYRFLYEKEVLKPLLDYEEDVEVYGVSGTLKTYGIYTKIKDKDIIEFDMSFDSKLSIFNLYNLTFANGEDGVYLIANNPNELIYKSKISDDYNVKFTIYIYQLYENEYILDIKTPLMRINDNANLYNGLEFTTFEINDFSSIKLNKIGNVDISGKEDKTNKLTRYLEYGTDDNYPSAKLVKSNLDLKLNITDFDNKYKTLVETMISYYENYRL